MMHCTGMGGLFFLFFPHLFFKLGGEGPTSQYLFLLPTSSSQLGCQPWGSAEIGLGPARHSQAEPVKDFSQSTKNVGNKGSKWSNRW